MNKRLLTLDDLYSFYSNRKNSMHFDSSKSGEPIVVQVKGSLKFENTDDDTTLGLTPVRLQACHTEKNLNKSSISYEVMANKLLPTFKNRPILGFIHDVNGVPQFYGHNAHEVDGDIVYDEIAVGNIPETNNAELVYDEENDRYNVMIDGYIYDEYTKAAQIIQREEECPCSVEISIKSMSFDGKEHVLTIEDGYFSGVTILGYDDNGNKVKPGMANSNVKLKDFLKSNNSLFSSISKDTHTKLIETLDNLNKTLSSLNINSKNNTKLFEEGGNVENMTKFEELLEKYGKTADDITFEYADMTDEELEVKFAELFDESEDEPEIEVPETDDNDDADEPEVKETESQDDDTAEDESKDESDNTSDEDNNEEKENFTKTFELSHEDVRSSLYALLAPLEETLNEWYWIANVYDTYFIYQSCCGNYYKQKYVTENDSVAFDGERQEVFAEFVTDEERKELEAMRSNYSSVVERLSKYEEAEELADKMTVFEDEAYKNYLETDEFKTLMSVENVKKFTKEELAEKADAALGKVVKTTKTFAMNTETEKKDKKPSFLAFSRVESNTSFLDGLLKK